MPFFFNGRLWISPATMSRVDDSATFNRNLNVGNVLAVIGRASGGKPNTALRFGSAAEAAAVLRSGDLVDAIARAFDPSAETTGPALVIALRVNPALQASLALKDALAATVINLVSTDFGQYTNQIKAKIEAASVKGFKLTTQFGNAFFTQDNVFRNAFSVRYTGAAASANMSVDSGTNAITLQAPNATTVATIDLTQFKTVQEVVDYINTVPGFTAAVLDGNGAKPALNGLDNVNAQDVKTATYNAVANLQAIIDWFNGLGEGFVTATRAAAVGTVPVAIPFTYLAGGSDGTVTNTQWSDAFTTLQASDVQWVVPLSSDPAIHAMADAHCAFMSNIARKERRARVGMALGTTDSAAVDAAKLINSDRTSIAHLGFYEFDQLGTLTLYPPYILAALLGGMSAGVNPGTSLTNKTIKVRGLERDLRNPTDTDVLIEGGVLCVENTPEGFKVVKDISSWLVNDNYNRVEVATGVALDFTVRNVRQALDGLRGSKGTPAVLNLAVTRAETALRALSVPEPVGPGVLAGDAENPPYKNIVAKLEGDVLSVEFQCSPVIPVNYIPVTVFAVPFSGTATA